MGTGVVARFDSRRGFGFVIPDDGGEDLFVHQNNIEMDGFRFLRTGERVAFELEIGDKGRKAVGVKLLDPRPEQDGNNRGERDYESRDNRDSGDSRGEYGRNGRERNDYERGGRYGGERAGRRRGGAYGAAAGGANTDKLQETVDRLRRKQERLLSLLVEKGVLAPGDIDGLDGTRTVTPAEPAAEEADYDAELGPDGEPLDD